MNLDFVHIMSAAIKTQTGQSGDIVIYVPVDVFAHIEMEVIGWQAYGNEDYVRLPTVEREIRLTANGPDIVFRPESALQKMQADAQDNWWWRKKANEAERDLNEIKRKAS